MIKGGSERAANDGVNVRLRRCGLEQLKQLISQSQSKQLKPAVIAAINHFNVISSFNVSIPYQLSRLNNLFSVESSCKYFSSGYTNHGNII